MPGICSCNLQSRSIMIYCYKLMIEMRKALKICINVKKQIYVLKIFILLVVYGNTFECGR